MQLDDFIQDVARGAGEIIKSKYHITKTWRAKTSRGDIVTEVDEESERYILGRLCGEYPEYAVLSEESGASGEGETAWVVDPLDGTRNYMMGIPFFCVSIGLSKNGRAEAGAIYDPIHDEMFYSRRGAGAFMNGVPIVVSKETSVEDCVISVSWVKHKVNRTRFIEYIEDLSKDTSYFRRFGSAALVMAYVACGRLHGYMQGGLHPWDVAAGVCLIEEAGGVVTDFEGNPIDLRCKDIEMVTANPALHSILINEVIGKHR